VDDGAGRKSVKIVNSNVSFKSAGATPVQADMIIRGGE